MFYSYVISRKYFSLIFREKNSGHHFEFYAILFKRDRHNPEFLIFPNEVQVVNRCQLDSRHLLRMPTCCWDTSAMLTVQNSLCWLSIYIVLYSVQVNCKSFSSMTSSHPAKLYSCEFQNPLFRLRKNLSLINLNVLELLIVLK